MENYFVAGEREENPVGAMKCITVDIYRRNDNIVSKSRI